MKLQTQGREYYALNIVTSPGAATTDWEASFDGGETYVAAIDLNRDGIHWSAWMVQGVDAPLPVPSIPVVTTITQSVTPRVRLMDDPEVIVRDMADFKIYIDA